MVKRILVDAVHPEETRVAVADDSKLIEFDFETLEKKQIKSNIYLGKITRVEPSLQAAFVEYGGNRQGFLPFSEIHYDYYQIPTEDKEKLAAAIRAEIERQEKLEESEFSEQEKREAEKALAQTTEAPALHASDAHYIAQSNEVLETANSNINADANQAHIIAEPVLVEKASDTSALSAEIITAAATNAVVDGEVKLPESPLSDIDLEAIRKAAELEKQFALEIMGEEYVVEKYGDILNDVLTEPQDDISAAVEDAGTRSDFYKQYRIQEVIKRNQVVLVQVVKEERGNKGASLTTYIAMPGRFCVFMPNTEKGGGVSRRIASYSDRKRMRDTLKQLDVPQGTSVILRTAGVDKEPEEIKRDLDYLAGLWNNIRKQTMESNAPALIYEESDLVKRSLRDLFRNDVAEIVIEGDQAYNSTAQFMEAVAPSQAGIIKKHTGKQPIFEQYKIEEQLDELYEPVCKLESGGYIVLTPTEALVSIDVNSGRATRERSVEDTAYRTNIEAAREIARQLRLRDLAGLVVIDFIDMRDVRNRKGVERELKDALKADRSKIQVGRISPFGLLEMSRQRLRSSIVEASSVACPMCKGLGVVRSNDSQSMKILRAIEAESSRHNVREIRVEVSFDLAFALLNKMRNEIKAIEDKDDVKIYIEGNHDFLPNQFKVDSVRGRNKRDNNEPNNGRTPERADYSNNYRNDKPEGKANNAEGLQNDDAEAKKPYQPRANRHQHKHQHAASNAAAGANAEIPDYLLAEEAQMPDYNSIDVQASAGNRGRNQRRHGKNDTRGEGRNNTERTGDRNSDRPARSRGGRNRNRNGRRDFGQKEYGNNFEQSPNLEPLNDNSSQKSSYAKYGDNGVQNINSGNFEANNVISDEQKSASAKLKGLWKKITS
jgi:ribonuclease E